MEQAVNTFTKGLLIDTNPMILGNDTITDALNATLITMNSNEIILQNDMGNRRVNNAYLPSGYLPVGMKEYGGIIYVAAYNPITNKSQIGSFPSPLRKFTSEDNLSGSFDFDSVLNDSNTYSESIYGNDIKFLKNDTFLVPLTKDNVIHAGDKFAIYAENLSSLWQDITNYNNTISGNKTKAYSPKNRKYTLQVGILNSQNEFVDITEKLCRWKPGINGWKPVNYTSEYTAIYKFNDGYFISDDFTDPNLNQTINDAEFIRKRQMVAANTYSYKLVGPMYLKVTLNHIENFNYNIYGTYDINTRKAKLQIEGYLTYNCPDFFGGGKPTDKTTNTEYVTLDQIKPNFEAFTLLNETLKESIYNNSVYDNGSKMYQVKIVKKYNEILPSSNENHIYNYFIGIPSYNDNDIYIKGLSVKGSIDLSLLGSGRVYMKGWRFYNNMSSKSTTLTFSLDAYPEYGKRFSNLRFRFTDFTDPTKTIYYPKSNKNNINYDGLLPVYNGRLTITMDWNELGFEPRTTYEVEIVYDIIDDNLNNVEKNKFVNEDNVHWFLTTELFNEFYLSDSGIEDFCTVNTEDPNDPNYNLKFVDKLKISIQSLGNLNTSNILREEDYISGNLISKTCDISYTNRHRYTVNVTSNPIVSIVNEELYPKYVTVSENAGMFVKLKKPVLYSINGVQTKDNEITSKLFKEFLYRIEGENFKNSKEAFTNATIVDSNLYTINLQIFGTFDYYDIYKGYNENKITYIENGFGNMFETAVYGRPRGTRRNDDILPNEDKGTFGGIDLHKNESNSKDEHWLYVAYSLPSIYLNELIGKLFPNMSLEEYNKLDEYRKQIAYEKADLDDGKFKFDFKTYEEQAYNIFNSHISEGQMFIYMFPSNNYFYIDSLGLEVDSENYLLSGYNNYARVWFRCSGDRWALIPRLLHGEDKYEENGNKNFNEILNSAFKQDYVYNKYDIYRPGENDIKLYTTNNNDYAYYDNYNIPIVYSVSYEFSEGNNVESILQVGNRYGNLRFIKSNSLNSNCDYFTLNLKSSDQFITTIQLFNASEIKNIEIKNGTIYDYDGNLLNPNYFYSYISYYPTASLEKTSVNAIIDNNGVHSIEYIKRNPSDNFKNTGQYLEIKKIISGSEELTSVTDKTLNSSYKVTSLIMDTTASNHLASDSDNKIKVNDDISLNSVIYKAETRGCPEIRYDLIPGSNHGRTHVDYDGTIIVKL